MLASHLKGGLTGIASLAACERWQPDRYSTLTSTSVQSLMSAASIGAPGCIGCLDGPKECSDWDATRTLCTCVGRSPAQLSSAQSFEAKRREDN